VGFRLRRRLHIMPGVYLNLSKSGVSTSIGSHGATLNLSKRGTRTTVSLPGSGLSYRSPTRPWAQGGPVNDSTPDEARRRFLWPGIIIALAIAIVVGATLAAGQ
jgi:hypothetical protein